MAGDRFRWITYGQALRMPRGEILDWLTAANERWMKGGEAVAVPARDEARF